MKITEKFLPNSAVIRNIEKFEANRVSIDSRDITGGEVFVAIKRGHEYVREALNKGAAIAIIDDQNYEIPGKTILVKDSIEALKLIGLHAKGSANLEKIVAITGSVGKTTTRLWLNSCLSNKYNTFSGIKNYNTIYGVPICLSLLEVDSTFGIFEFGTNNLGEIAELSNYLKPDIGVITNVYESHLGRFGNRNNLLNEKAAIIDGIMDHGALVYDGDSEFAEKIEQRAKAKNLQTYSVGFSEPCDFSIISYGEEIRIKTPSGIFDYKISAFGKHFAYVSVSIVAIIYALGLDITEFLPYFSKLAPIDGRGSIMEFTFNEKTFNVIDDSYNASPSAVGAALDAFALMPYQNKVAIIGQMKELGEHEDYYHKLIAYKLSSMNLANVFFVGEKHLWPIMNEFENIICFEKIDNFAIEKIMEIVQNGSIVFLKGSRSIELNKFLDYIKCSIA